MVCDNKYGHWSQRVWETDPDWPNLPDWVSLTGLLYIFLRIFILNLQNMIMNVGYRRREDWLMNTQAETGRQRGWKHCSSCPDLRLCQISKKKQNATSTGISVIEFVISVLWHVKNSNLAMSWVKTGEGIMHDDKMKDCSSVRWCLGTAISKRRERQMKENKLSPRRVCFALNPKL